MNKMSREEILNIPAGKELDALIAEKIMGWHFDSSVSKLYWLTDDKKRVWLRFFSSDTPENEFEPSDDISHAWEVVEHFTGKECDQQDFFIECWSDGEWLVAFHPMGYSSREPMASCDGRKTKSPSAPLAICRAALVAVLDE